MLDSAREVGKYDKNEMLGIIGKFPKHLRDGYKRGLTCGPPKFAPDSFVVAGMGGSAIGGDLLSTWMAETGVGSSCEVCRSYALPPHVGKKSLVVVASYSGNTEETLAMFESARRRGSKLVSISSGGRLKELSETYSVPHCGVPSGLVPRASLGHVFGSLLGIVDRAGIASPSAEIDAARRTLTRLTSSCSLEKTTSDNPAKQLAHELFGNIPVVIGYGLSRPVGKRWANQLNENSKVLAFSSSLPEMDHNEIVGWVSDGRSQGFSPVFLEHDVADEAMIRRLSETKAMLCDRARVHCAYAQGEHVLSKMLSLVVFGDFVSAYLGILRKEDPSSTEPIERLKRNLSKKST